MVLPTHLILPDLLAHSSAFTDATSPHWARASEESLAWVMSYDVFNDRRHAALANCQGELLVSHTYCYADYDEFRTVCDFINLLFVIDELSDEQSAAGARDTGDVFLRVLRDVEWTDGSKVAAITKEYVASPPF